MFKNKRESYKKTFSKCRDWVISNSYSSDVKKEDCEYSRIHNMRKEFAQDFYEREVQENGIPEKEVK